MHFIRPACVALALVFTSTTSLLAQSAPTAAQSPAPAKPRVASSGGVSPHETISTVIGVDRKTGNRVTITYGRP